VLQAHGVMSGVTVLLDHASRPFGVLAAHSVHPRAYSADDVNFVQGIANILGLAIEREQSEAERARLHAQEREARAEAEAAVQRAEEERRTIETLHRLGSALSAELDLQRLLQLLTDEGRVLTGAQFGAFFFNSRDGRYLLYTLSGAPLEAFAGFAAPRGTAIFGPTFEGQGIVRLADVTADPRFGQHPPHHGLPRGRLPVRSYLAVPVVSRSGAVLGGLFFGHEAPGVFTERHERLLAAVAAHAAVAIDNAQLYQEARTAIAARDDFLARASHELRTPLTVVKGHVALLGRRLFANPAEADRLIAVAQRHIGQMNRLITELLDASRLEAGQLVLEPVPLDLKTVAAEATIQALTLAEEKDVRLTEDVPPHLTVVGDPVKLEQVLMNLLANAVKHTPAGGVVRIEGARRDDVVELRVCDTGEGIAREHLERIFEPFYQIGSAVGRRKAAGNGVGLGLAIARRLVELHGGRVHAESAGPGHGSTFVVVLPLAVPRGGAPPSADL
jgi:signal transduction histidine kinase